MSDKFMCVVIHTEGGKKQGAIYIKLPDEFNGRIFWENISLLDSPNVEESHIRIYTFSPPEDLAGEYAGVVEIKTRYASEM